MQINFERTGPLPVASRQLPGSFPKRGSSSLLMTCWLVISHRSYFYPPVPQEVAPAPGNPKTSKTSLQQSGRSQATPIKAWVWGKHSTRGWGGGIDEGTSRGVGVKIGWVEKNSRANPSNNIRWIRSATGIFTAYAGQLHHIDNASSPSLHSRFSLGKQKTLVGQETPSPTIFPQNRAGANLIKA